MIIRALVNKWWRLGKKPEIDLTDAIIFLKYPMKLQNCGAIFDGATITANDYEKALKIVSKYSVKETKNDSKEEL